MIVALDSTFLCMLFNEKVELQGLTPQQARQTRRRVEHLIETLSEKRSKIIIPTPALAEVLAIPDIDMSAALHLVSNQSAFSIRAFDYKAAVEVAKRSRPEPGEDKRLDQDGQWQKIKVDRQIVAIAIVSNAERIYSSDERSLAKFAQRCGIETFDFATLPDPPPEDGDLFADDPF